MRITEIVVHDPMKKRICVVYITSRLQPKEDNLSTTAYNNAKPGRAAHDQERKP